MPYTLYRFIRIFPIMIAMFAANISHAKETVTPTVSIGVIQDQVENAAVRILAKYGESLSVTDKIVPQSVSGDRGIFYNVSREFTLDTAEKGNFGGLSFRYGIKRYSVGMKTDPNAPPRDDGQPVVKFDGDKWMHIVPMYIGIDTDGKLKNKDYLIEVGYIPALYKSTDSCFKLGANPIIGVSAQLGRRTRSSESTEESGSLRRLKLEGKMDFRLSCVFNTPTGTGQDSSNPLNLIFSDIGEWQIIASSTGWQDFSEDKTYKKHELTVRIPTGSNAFIDFKRDIGAAPTNFDTGGKFSANLTIQF